MTMENLFTNAEMIHGPLTAIIRYLNEGMIPSDFWKNPRLVFTSTDYDNKRSSPWQMELMEALMDYSKMKKPALASHELREMFGVHHEPGGKWLCARKVIVPGHFSTPIPGSLLHQHTSSSVLTRLLSTPLASNIGCNFHFHSGRIEKQIFRTAVCNYYQLKCDYDQHEVNQADGRISAMIVDRPHSGMFDRYVCFHSPSPPPRSIDQAIASQFVD
jgi:hypothetical protein